MSIDPKDLALLIRDKHAGDARADLREDIERLEDGEPLAYVIGWVPFLGLTIRLDSRPLIPRPETEWWTEVLIAHIQATYAGEAACRVLDLCAGSGAIGLGILAKVANAHVSFAELSPLHSALIALNITGNALNEERTTVRSGDLFASYPTEKFHIIATNPPYIPTSRELEDSVLSYEPREALYAGEDGLGLIRRIVEESPLHLYPGGALWMECDIENIEQAGALMRARGFQSVEIRNDHYGRPRIVVGYFL